MNIAYKLKTIPIARGCLASVASTLCSKLREVKKRVAPIDNNSQDMIS